MYTLARRHNHHSSPTSGMRQWKIPKLQRSTGTAENSGGGALSFHIMGLKSS